MFSNYFKIAWRNLTRNRSNAIINVIGLSIGIACCLLIMLWVTDELSYDNWNKNADRTFRLAAEINFGGSHRTYALSPAPLSKAIVDDFPEVESAMRFWNTGSTLVKRDVQNFMEEKVIHADSSLFSVFDLKLLAGDKSALNEPNSLVISQSAATKYFSREEALGNTLIFDNNREYEITGVIEDIPDNSHFQFDFIISLTGEPRANDGIWVSHNFPTYFLLKEGVDFKAFEAKFFPHLLEKYIAPQVESMMGATYEEILGSGAFIRYYLQPIRDIHLNSDLVGELAPNGSMQYVWIFLSAAFFILIIACVNFMNLTTAYSALRAKEIGVRKVMGSLKINLIGQFLSESLLLTFFAFVIGLLLAQSALPAYNALATKNLSIPYSSSAFWAFAVAGTILVGLISGSYPAFYLSGFKPIQTLSGRLFEGKRNNTLRSGLVIFQFLIAVILIVGTLGIQKQMDYIQNKKLGFDKERVLILQDAFALGNNQRAFKRQMTEHPSILSASYSSFLPVPSSRSDSPLCKSAEIRDDNCVSIQMWDIDEDYLETLGIKLAQGRNFDPMMATDSQAVIINQTAARLLDFENPVNSTLYGTLTFDLNAPPEMTPIKVIGVVEDFHFESLRDNIGALSFFLDASSGYLSLKLSTGNPESAIAHAEKTWEEMAPGQPFSYKFMDESVDRMYKTELRVGMIFKLFSALGIFIACLGLFGLAAFATERRTREIGIRKVLGASTMGIVSLLSRDFLRLVILSLVMAVPLSWYIMNQWLANFAYKTDLDIWIFAIAGLVSILVAFLTVGFHSFQSATSNPINSLRSE